ncbi:response regulator [Lutispora thermophila]|uniref:Stage 0 sporulation protein A homolog n=1 Tax=Lutispora thermophila DSM 19022 TaxID=1122184 RepID=A0A1M6D5H1_9FIRM|nr:response regulator [Lutispora thermophila]SHI68381.1 two-component system, chemotaxis family, response regulator CheY [Lutispora thermophila DSM 19022]
MKRVLIVDDAAFMRLAIKTILEKNGFEVVGEAKNGIEGIQKFKELQPDIVTMDITMPDMSGIEALKAIHAISPNANVVMLSAMGQEVMVKEAIMSGAKSFVVKPFKEEHLIKTLEKIANS